MFSDKDFPYLNNVRADSRLLGHPTVLSPFCHQNSANRLTMYAQHIDQIIIPDKCEQPQCFTGFEQDVGSYEIISQDRPEDCEVLAVVPKYASKIGLNNIAKNPLQTVIVLQLETNTVHCFDICTYYKGTDGFGFETIMENQQYLRKGSFLPKDAILSRSPARDGSFYKLGLNANVAYIDLPGTMNDAVMISEEFAKKATTTSINKRSIYIKATDYPINYHGDLMNNKFILDIGDVVRNDGILCAFRPLGKGASISDINYLASNRVYNNQDIIHRIPPGSTIVDLDVYVCPNRENIPWGIFQQLEKYLLGAKEYWQTVFQVYMQYKDQYKLTPAFNDLATNAILFCRAHGVHVPGINPRTKVSMLNKADQPIEFLQIDITYSYKREFSAAFKTTDRNGTKGVVKIYPKEAMPIDEQGLRAEICLAPGSVFGRMNYGQLTEPAITRVAEFVRRKAAECAKTDVLQAYETILDFLNDINPNYKDLVRRVVGDDISEYVKECIDDRIYINTPPYLETTYKDTFITDLTNKWNAYPSVVRYKKLDANDNLTEEEVVVKDPVWIGSKYIYVLCKTPKVASPGIGRIGHSGLPVKVPPGQRGQFLVSPSPTRFGEDERRGTAQAIGVDNMDHEVRFMGTQSGSPIGVKTMVEKLMTEPSPTRIKQIPVTTEALKATYAPTTAFHHIMSVLGVDITECRVSEDAFPDWVDIFGNVESVSTAETIEEEDKGLSDDLPEELEEE